MNTTILQEISFQLHKGNPWWGLALCNEYMSQHSPLRLAMIQRFTSRIGEHGASSKIAKLLIKGRRKGDLPTELQNALGTRFPRTRSATDVTPHGTTLHTKRVGKTTARTPSRTRAIQTPRYSSRATPTGLTRSRDAYQPTDVLRASSNLLCIVTKRS